MHTFPCTTVHISVKSLVYMFRVVSGYIWFLTCPVPFLLSTLCFLGVAMLSLLCQLAGQALSLLCPERQQKLQIATLKDPLF